MFHIDFLKKLENTQNLNSITINRIKRELAKKYKLNKYPSNYEIYLRLSDHLKKKYKHLMKYLITKPSRTDSGVAPLAVMSYPYPCPHGKCITCPGGPNSNFGSVPQSYTGHEPAAMRAIRNNYDAYLQVFNRLEQYAILNHNFEKVEIIVMGGTFLSFPEKYQYSFITNIYNAINDFSKTFMWNKKLKSTKFKQFFELNKEFKNSEKTKRIQQKILQLKIKNKNTLTEAKKINEKANIRAVALCIETRPDYCKEKDINKMLEFGATRVEIGVQSVFDDVLNEMQRGHGTKEVIEATRLAKDSFLKVTYHMMLGLPKSSYKRDLEAFKILFKDQNYKPDALKIYPTEILEGTELYTRWKNKKYDELELDKTIDLLIKIKQIIPKYCRIMRIQRDIPSNIAKGGIRVTNLRQLVNQTLDQLLKIQKTKKFEELKNLKYHISNELKKEIKTNKLHKCNCIRCREISRRKPKNEIKINIDEIHYKASKGDESYIELKDENSDSLIGFVRLRNPYKPFRKELENTVGIRQLHVYGSALKLGQKSKQSYQHQGFGKQLMKLAEQIAKERYGAKKIAVISGIGVREYYRKQGYQKQGAYMIKKIK